MFQIPIWSNKISSVLLIFDLVTICKTKKIEISIIIFHSFRFTLGPLSILLDIHVYNIFFQKVKYITIKQRHVIGLIYNARSSLQCVILCVFVSLGITGPVAIDAGGNRIADFDLLDMKSPETREFQVLFNAFPLGNFSCFCCLLFVFVVVFCCCCVQNQLFRKILSGLPPGCQTVWHPDQVLCSVGSKLFVKVTSRRH